MKIVNHSAGDSVPKMVEGNERWWAPALAMAGVFLFLAVAGPLVSSPASLIL